MTSCGKLVVWLPVYELCVLHLHGCPIWTGIEEVDSREIMRVVGEDQWYRPNVGTMSSSLAGLLTRSTGRLGVVSATLVLHHTTQPQKVKLTHQAS
ncbi:hypothetical protein Cantr_01817 [Candida viswanathii]|uniref:Uncharacterized protein n=1 Tax=Candida viswanathii TaxID=5486 RepID=A0A367YJP6_9ASCO|nr:hypothetical protein Cantr_01817 [Candida viswanathii]